MLACTSMSEAATIPAVWSPSSIGGHMRPELTHQAPHLIFANAGSVRPLPEPDPPILPRSSRVPRCQDDMKVGQPVAQDKAVDVLGPSNILQCSRQTVHQ